MRRSIVLLLLLSLLLGGCARSEPPAVDEGGELPSPASSEPDGRGELAPVLTRVRLVAAEGAQGPVWQDEAGRVDPVLVMEAGALVDIELVIEDGGVHGFAIDGHDLARIPMTSTTLQAVMPLEGTATYACPVHPTTMVGQIRVAPGAAPMRLASMEDAEPLVADVPSSTEPEIVAHMQDARYFFTAAGSSERNPDIAIPANSTIRVHFTVDAGVHNFGIAGQRSEIMTEGDTLEYTFESGPDGILEYWCDPHRGAGMRGRFLVGAYDPYPGKILTEVDVSELQTYREAQAGDVLRWRNGGDAALTLAIQTATGRIDRDLGPHDVWDVVLGGEGALHVTAMRQDVRMLGHVRIT